MMCPFVNVWASPSRCFSSCVALRISTVGTGFFVDVSLFASATGLKQSRINLCPRSA